MLKIKVLIGLILLLSSFLLSAAIDVYQFDDPEKEDRFQKLAINQKESSAEKFLKAGNTVDISGEWLGDVSVIFVEP